MGSPLGVLFAQAFMASVEEVLANVDIRPALYCRYVDDILVEVQDLAMLNKLKSRLEEVSGLNFTVEEAESNRINFLNVSINADDGSFITSVFRKPTDEGKCLNADSACPQRYKTSVIKAYVN